MSNLLRITNKIEPLGIWDSIPSDSINSVVIEFEFAEDWKNLLCVAQFTQGEKTYNVVIENNRCVLPTELKIGNVMLSVFGTKTDGTPFRETSIPFCFEIYDAGFTSTAETPIPPTPDLYEQLIDKFAHSSGVAALNGKTGNVDIVADEGISVDDTETGKIKIKNTATITVDPEMSDTSENPVQNKAITGELKKLKELGETQSDWDINDNTSPSYVKNRPFYSESQTVNYQEIIETQTDIESAIEGEYINYSNGPVGLIDGEAYSVTMTDPATSEIIIQATVTARNAKDVPDLSELFSFDCIALYDSDNDFVLFDGAKFSINSTGYPEFTQDSNSFIITNYDTPGLIIKVEGKGISNTVETIYKIPEKYLPETKSTRYYREITIDLPLFTTQPTYTPSSADLFSIFKTDEQDHMFYWAKMVSGSSTDFTLHYTENGTDDPIGGITFSMPDPPIQVNKLVRFKLSEDGYTMLMGQGMVISLSKYKLNLPKNLKYVDIDLYRTATSINTDSTYPKAKYDMSLIGNTGTAPGYLTNIEVSSTSGLYPTRINGNGHIYDFSSYGFICGEDSYQNDYVYLTSLNHNHIRVRSTPDNYVSCLGYTDGVFINSSSNQLSATRPSFENLRYYDRIPMSSRVRQNDGISYSDLAFYNVVFQNGDKIILQGELDV